MFGARNTASAIECRSNNGIAYRSTFPVCHVAGTENTLERRLLLFRARRDRGISGADGLPLFGAIAVLPAAYVFTCGACGRLCAGNVLFPVFADRQFLYRRNPHSVSGRAARPKHALVALCDFPDSVSHLLAANRELERKFCRASRLQCGGALDCLRAYPICGLRAFIPFKLDSPAGQPEL